MRSITGFVFCFLSTLLLTMSHPETFVGKWKLIETYDEEFQVVELPTGVFDVNLQPDESIDNVLNVFIKVGNNMRSQITFVGEAEQGDIVTVGSLMSTMMMPSEPLFRLETYLSNTLPKITMVQKEVVEDKTLLIFSGLGKIVCQKVDS